MIIEIILTVLIAILAGVFLSKYLIKKGQKKFQERAIKALEEPVKVIDREQILEVYTKDGEIKGNIIKKEVKEHARIRSKKPSYPGKKDKS